MIPKNYTNNNRFFIIDLTKSQIDTIQKQFLEEMDELLDRVRRKKEIKQRND